MIRELIRKMTCALTDCRPPRSRPLSELDQKMHDIPTRIDRLIQQEHHKQHILEQVYLKDRARRERGDE